MEAVSVEPEVKISERILFRGKLYCLDELAQEQINRHRAEARGAQAKLRHDKHPKIAAFRRMPVRYSGFVRSYLFVTGYTTFPFIFEDISKPLQPTKNYFAPSREVPYLPPQREMTTREIWQFTFEMSCPLDRWRPV